MNDKKENERIAMPNGTSIELHPSKGEMRGYDRGIKEQFEEVTGAVFLRRLIASHRDIVATTLGIAWESTDRELRDAIREVFPAMTGGGYINDYDFCPLCTEDLYGLRPHKLGHAADCPVFLSKDQDRAEGDADWDREQERLKIAADPAPSTKPNKQGS